MKTAELLSKVRKVEIRTKGLSQRLFSGQYHSAFKGRGMSFAEVRPYQFGDDVRNIDWNVTARYHEPYIKTFEEERELSVMLLIDMSASDAFGTQGMIKSDLVTELAAVFSFSAISNNDKVGAIFFTDKIEKFIPPRKGRSHILYLIRELIDFKPQGVGTDLGLALGYLNRVIKKRCICFVISDFLAKDYRKDLRVAALKHDLIGVRIYDPVEEVLPNVGILQLLDPETSETIWMDTSDTQAQKEYALHRKKMRKSFSDKFSKNGADSIQIELGKPYLPALFAFFKRREKRFA